MLVWLSAIGTLWAGQDAHGHGMAAFLAVQIISFVLILVYCTAHELVRVIGKEKMLRLFFGPTPLPAFEEECLASLGLPIFP